MKSFLRHEVIMQLIHTRFAGGVDVLNRDFVTAYARATGAKVTLMDYGADSCPQLGADLSAMYTAGRLTRKRVGVPRNAGPGLPTWKYVYQIKEGMLF
jgi:hypothetical protein